MTNTQHHLLPLSQLVVFISMVKLNLFFVGVAVILYIGALLILVISPMTFASGGRIPQRRKVSIVIGDVIIVTGISFVVWLITIPLR